MKKIFVFTALFCLFGSCWLFSLWPDDKPIKMEKNALILTDTTYFECKGKECRLIKLRTRPCLL